MCLFVISLSNVALACDCDKAEKSTKTEASQTVADAKSATKCSACGGEKGSCDGNCGCEGCKSGKCSGGKDGKSCGCGKSGEKVKS